MKMGTHLHGSERFTGNTLKLMKLLNKNALTGLHFLQNSVKSVDYNVAPNLLEQ
jgi:hypothetical protein